VNWEAYLAIGVLIGGLRGLDGLADYLADWYRYRHIVDRGASLGEFCWLFIGFFFSLFFFAVLWPFWLWYKFAQYYEREE